MRTAFCILALVLGTSGLPGECAPTTEAPIASPAISTNHSAKAVAAAKERGAASAAKDIKAGKLRVLYFGKPWSVGRPLVDDVTGYPVEIVAGCSVTEEFVAEVEAYNNAMREWQSKSKAANAKNKKQEQGTSSR